MVKRQKSINITWKIAHKWIGAVFAFFLLSFCISGILLNHRELIKGYDVPRSMLPSSYSIQNYNNGIIKGTLPLSNDTIIAFGNVGTWLTDRKFSQFLDFNSGLLNGVDHRNIRNVIRVNDELWCAAQYNIYYNRGYGWKKINLQDNNERISDISYSKEGGLIAMTRSEIFRLDGKDRFVKIPLGTPIGYENKATLFKTIWHLHSGELFGITGKVVVDIIALILIFLSFSGLIIFTLPNTIRRVTNVWKRKLACCLRWNFRWHNNIGYWTALFIIAIAFTGMCLRPPLMVPLVLTKTKPIPASSLDSKNPWHDKLRVLRWDSTNHEWLLSTSEGFYRIDKSFQSIPLKVEGLVPPVSPMGITVFEEVDSNKWLIGSFSGMFLWDTANGEVTDYFTKAPYLKRHGGRPISDHLISGYSRIHDISFDYKNGAAGLPATPKMLQSQPMSLWNVALEVHVGRIYSGWLGPLSDLFIFLSGAITIIVIISGVLIYKKIKSNKSHQ